MSEAPHLVISSGTESEKHIKGVAASLPKYTPVFFKVDQVNTVLYTVTITQEKPKSAEAPKSTQAFSVDAAYKEIEQAKKHCPEKSAQAAFEALKQKIKTVAALNKELDKLLERTETPKFYVSAAAEVNAAFTKIATEAEALTKEKLCLPKGTAQDICDAAAAALAVSGPTSTRLSIPLHWKDASLSLARNSTHNRMRFR